MPLCVDKANVKTNTTGHDFPFYETEAMVAKISNKNIKRSNLSTLIPSWQHFPQMIPMASSEELIAACFEMWYG